MQSPPWSKKSAAIDVPPPDLGATVASVVALDQEQYLDPAALQEALPDELARLKQPKACRAVDGLTRNIMGKVQKAQLQDQFSELFRA